MRPISPDSRERNSKAADIERVTSGRVATSYLTVIWSFPTRAVSTASAGGSPRLACSASPLISGTPAKSHPEPKTQHPNHKKREKQTKSASGTEILSGAKGTHRGWRAARCGPGAWTGRGRRTWASTWACTPAPALWSTPSCPASPDGSPGAARRRDGSAVASRRIGGQIPARWRKRRGEGRWRGWNCEDVRRDGGPF